MNKVVKTGASLLATTALAASAFAAAAGPAQSAPVTAKATSPACNLNLERYSDVRANSRGRAVVAAECLLSRAGYTMRSNGTFSAEETKQVAKFKASVGLRGSVIDKAAWTALLSRGSTPTLRKGSKGDAVIRVQRALRATGRSVNLSGTYDAKTVKAVKGVQHSRGWKSVGSVGPKTWKVLQNGQAATPKKVSSHKSKGQVALAFAKKQLGEKYRYGAAGPNAWDCSGLTMKSWAAAGKKLPHSARGQFKKGKSVSKKNLKPGDLVFFYSGISHVAIYAGNGKVIHASRPGKPVAYIKMKYMPYKGARRIA